MQTMTRLFLLMALSLVSTACAIHSEKEDKINNGPTAKDFIVCEDPRPQICTREYRPVCATLKDESIKTYSTGCTSCSDPAVKAYKLGTCH